MGFSPLSAAAHTLSSGATDAADGSWFARIWKAKSNNNGEESCKREADLHRQNQNYISCPKFKLKQQQQQQAAGPRFALEFDGLHCFETIVRN